MALVVFLRGVNVGGHKTFRPSVVAKELAHLGVVNVGAAGTFVVRKPVSQAALRAELARRMPFDTEVMICKGADVLRLAAADPFGELRAAKDVVCFASVLASRRASSSRPSAPLPPTLPAMVPAAGRWLVKVLGAQDRIIYGVYRREMKAIGCLGQLDRMFGVPVTTRNWNTFASIADILEGRG